MLEVAGHMTKEEAKLVIFHSGRASLPMCSKARGEPMNRQLELGAWSGSNIALSTAGEQVRSTNRQEQDPEQIFRVGSRKDTSGDHPGQYESSL